MNSKLSIVLVTYNAAETLEKSLRSIYNLNMPEVEVVIIDGASTDGTVDILKKYDSSIAFWLSEADSGIYNAMNKALDYISGDFVYFLGADDLVTADFPKFLNKVSDLNTIYYANVLLASTGEKYCGKINNYKLMQQNICHQALIYPSALLREYKYNERYKLLADYELNIRLRSKFGFKYFDFSVCFYNDAGASSSGDADFETDRLMIIQNNLGGFYKLLKFFRNMVKNLVRNRAF